ncbi:MAG: polyketide synthase dehydratase domain-containing protein [Thermodesulfobacteriota bacterium]
MGDLSQIEPDLRQPITIQVPAYMLDHAFAGKAVLPAVESMRLLVQSALDMDRSLHVRCLTQAAFEKFLALEPGQDRIEACVELARLQDGWLSTRLVTRMSHASSGISRVKEHARACLGQLTDWSGVQAAPWDWDSEIDMLVAADTVYKELVPFGPAYQNICGLLSLNQAAVTAEICAPSLAAQQQLGSPFVLDAAFHAACVWGQRYCGFIGFPLGFDSRYVLTPSQPGGRYKAQVLPISQSPREAVFDLWIKDQEECICEVVHGLQMRDVTGGSLQPPAWIQARP